MRISYWTTDEVNEHLAREVATEGGDTLCTLPPEDWPADGNYDAVVYDWDHLPAEFQQKVMRGLLQGPPPHAVAVHGYNLEDALAESLRRHDVAVYRRLNPKVFRLLRRATRAVRAARVPPDGVTRAAR